MNFYVSSLLVLILANCGLVKSPENSPEKTTKPSLSHKKAEFHRDRQAFRGENEKQPIDVLKYHLKGHFDWENLLLKATVEISLKLDSKTQTEILLDSAVSKIVSVSVGGQLSLPYETLKNSKLKIDISSLPEEKRDGEILLSIAYETDANNFRSVDGALEAVGAREGDPVKSRVVYSFSEPEGASLWLPCHNVPSDRAKFSSDFTMPINETLVANGTLLEDKKYPSSKTRRMRYETGYTLPTYLMAFALGEFDVTTQYYGNLPVAIVSRKGLPVDTSGMLTAIRRQLRTFESLLVPYPFEKYYLVLVPEFSSGGIEHAGITFQGEVSSTQSFSSDDLSLTAHELAHQWFGDLVTIESWDDLWIKEGMATLLQEEASRYFEDQNKTGRLFGHNFSVEDGEAIIDTSLSPLDKYTSGPYGRSAWLLTQIRAALGEKVFWGTLRDVLKTYRFDVINTDLFLEKFRPHLGDEQIAKVRKALVAKKLPEFLLQDFVFKFADLESAMISPFSLRWYEENGKYEAWELNSGDTKTIGKDEKRLLVLDPRDIHPISDLELGDSAREKALFAMTVPQSKATRKVLLSLSASNQLDALSAKEKWNISFDEFVYFQRNLSSENAKYRAIQMACEIGNKDPQNWTSPILETIKSPPYLGIGASGIQSGFSKCRTLIPSGIHASTWEKIKKDPSDRRASEIFLRWLSSMPMDANSAFENWKVLADRGYSVRVRLIALYHLFSHLKGEDGQEKPNESAAPVWKEYFRNILSKNDEADILTTALEIVAHTKDLESLPILTKLTLSKKRARVRKTAICTAYKIIDGKEDSWKNYVTSLGDPKQLPEVLIPYIQDAKKNCKSDDEDEE